MPKGGSKPGTGAKPVKSADLQQDFEDPEAFLRAVMNSKDVSDYLRVAAAKALMVKPAVHGKKNERQKAADEVGAGQFAPSEAPLAAQNPIH